MGSLEADGALRGFVLVALEEFWLLLFETRMVEVGGGLGSANLVEVLPAVLEEIDVSHRVPPGVGP